MRLEASDDLLPFRHTFPVSLVGELMTGQADRRTPALRVGPSLRVVHIQQVAFRAAQAVQGAGGIAHRTRRHQIPALRIASTQGREPR